MRKTTVWLRLLAKSREMGVVPIRLPLIHTSAWLGSDDIATVFSESLKRVAHPTRRMAEAAIHADRLKLKRESGNIEAPFAKVTGVETGSKRY